MIVYCIDCLPRSQERNFRPTRHGHKNTDLDQNRAEFLNFVKGMFIFMAFYRDGNGGRKKKREYYEQELINNLKSNYDPLSSLPIFT